MKNSALAIFISLALFSLPSTAQDTKDPPRKEPSGEIAPVTSKSVIYTPKVGDTLTYEINMDEKGAYKKKSHHDQLIIIGIGSKGGLGAKDGEISYMVRDGKDGRLYRSKWTPEGNFLDNFLGLHKTYESFKVESWTIPAVTLESGDGTCASFAMHGTRSAFPSQLFLMREDKILARLIKITRADDGSSSKKQK
jgi:hypothetical protein